jgi:ABC-2 type transport system permease protein
MHRPSVMLLYKAWLETRWRFVAALMLLVFISMYTVLRAKNIINDRAQLFPREHILYAQYIWIILFRGYLQSLWILSAVVLALGGLWREKAIGIAGFTLSLPVTRRRLLLTRAAIGVLEVVVLALVPCFLIWAVSTVTANSYSLRESLSHALLILAGGLIFYALGFLLSHIMHGEFSTPTLALGLCLLMYVGFNILRFEDFNPFDLMSGKHHLDPITFFLQPPVPWAAIATFTAVSAFVVLLSVRITESRDF